MAKLEQLNPIYGWIWLDLWLDTGYKWKAIFMAGYGWIYG
jgi:hypothetical protein